MFAPSPSPSHSPTLLSRPHAGASCHAQSLSRATFSPRYEQQQRRPTQHHRYKSTPPTPSPRTRIDDHVRSLIEPPSPILALPKPPHASPRPRVWHYADRGTQYSPTGLPPTARQPHHHKAGAVNEPTAGAGASGIQPQQQQRDSASNSSSGSTSPDGVSNASSDDIAAPLAGPTGHSQTHPRAHPSSSTLSSSPSVSPLQNGALLTSDSSQGSLPEKTLGETRTRVKDVIGGAGDAARKLDFTDDDDDDAAAAGGKMSERAKKQKHDPSVKVMPLKYEECNVKDLGVLVSDMLLELVRHNDSLPLKDGQLTRFHSRAPPGISISDYLSRLLTHASLTPPLLLSMVYYIDRLCALYPVFTISSLTVHRFLIAAATVAAKGLSDTFWTNNTYARVGGVTTRELALLELEFLEKMQWRIVPRPEVLGDYYRSLVERGDGHVMAKEEDLKAAAAAVAVTAVSPIADQTAGKGKEPEVTVKKADDATER